jgi:hypothetical protein
MKKFTLTLAAFAALGLTACGTGDTNTTVNVTVPSNQGVDSNDTIITPEPSNPGDVIDREIRTTYNYSCKKENMHIEALMRDDEAIDVFSFLYVVYKDGKNFAYVEPNAVRDNGYLKLEADVALKDGKYTIELNYYQGAEETTLTRYHKNIVCK